MTDNLSVRRPRVRLSLNGTPVVGCRTTEIISPRGAQAASFRVTASATDITRILGATWVDQDKLDVSIDFGFLPPYAREGDLTWTSMIVGNADRIALDQITGLVSLDGRDHAARLIDLPLQNGYLNTTSSELAQKLATLCSLSADIDQTTGLVGQYYQIQHTKNAFSGFSRHGNAWDLLAELADLEGYDLWVRGTTLFFKQPDARGGNLYDVTYTHPQEGTASPALSISDLSMERAFGLSGDLQVKVASWNSRQRRQVVGNFPNDASENTRQFLVLKPNLLPDEAEKLAQNTYSRLKAHQYVITGTMAGDLMLSPQHQLRLSGTGTGWDRVYTIDRIEREMSLEGGYIQHITARSDPDGETSDG